MSTPETPRSEDSSGLRRSLTLLDAVGIGFGAVIGAGIFVVTGVAAEVAGPALLVGLLIAAVCASANAFSSAQLAASYPQSGGTYEYGYRVLNPWMGFTAGWMFLAGKITAAGTVAIGLAGYLDALIPGLSPRPIAVGAVLVFTAINYFGIRRGSRVNLVIVAVSLFALLAFVITGALTAFDTDNFTPFAPAGWRGTLEAAALLFFAYAGYARVATLGEEVREPARNLPRAILLTLLGSAFLYAAVVLIAVGVAGTEAIGGTPAPLEIAARAIPVPGVGTLIAVGGLTAMLGVLLSQVMGLSRMVFAMARRGDLPGALEHVHPRYRVPHRAVLLVGAVTAAVAAVGTLRGVASAAAFTILVYYLIANLSALRMPAEKKLYPNFIPVVGIIACVLLPLSLPVDTIATGVVLLALGLLVRFGVRAVRG